MKWVPTPNQPFRTRLYLSDDKIDDMCSEALSETHLLPAEPQPIRIDRFIEKKFRAQIIFEELDKGILGFTAWGADSVEEIHIAQPAGNSPILEHRRENSTFAHEAGHCLMHTELYIEYSALARDHPELPPFILCREERTNTIPRKPNPKWWEVQANRAIGSLLMPKPLIPIFLEPFYAKFGTTKLSTLTGKARWEIAEAASNTFEVNQRVARIRLGLPY